MKHLFKSRIDGKKPVNNWYQSLGSNPWESPSIRHQTGFQKGRYLLRETPKRMYQWNTRRKKNISPKGKQLLVQIVLENETFNTKKESEHMKEKKKKTATSKREKESKCYICKTNRHAFWGCERRKHWLEMKHIKMMISLNK